MKFEIQTGHFRGTREGYLKNTRIEKKEAPMKKSAALILPAVGGVLSPVWQKGVISSRVLSPVWQKSMGRLNFIISSKV